MSVTKHHGTGVALMPEPVDPDERRWIWFSWYAATQSSEWLLPDGWQVLDQMSGVVVIGDDERAYSHCNGVLLQTSGETGRYLITNRVTFDNGESVDRTLQVKVLPL
ncbi:MAG TPA: hypothetical protein VL995_11485 [Cellvibrio sp.]|nr:hypothetical protein [Cellvibrio sp.]